VGYDPTLGRFIQPDSIVPDPLSSQSWNRYAYVNNNIINFNDPSGHFPLLLLVLALVGISVWVTSDVTPPKLPVSGYEPLSGYKPRVKTEVWTEGENCGSYALNDPTKKFYQPGSINKRNITPYDHKGDYTSDSVSDALEADMDELGMDIYDTTAAEACEEDHYKIALIISPEDPKNITNRNDFHFLRQDPDGNWSHKLAEADVTRVDASGRLISNPGSANYNYVSNHVNYTEGPMYFCLETNKEPKIWDPIPE
jgi:hypothetical protein